MSKRKGGRRLEKRGRGKEEIGEGEIGERSYHKREEKGRGEEKEQGRA